MPLGGSGQTRQGQVPGTQASYETAGQPQCHHRQKRSTVASGGSRPCQVRQECLLSALSKTVAMGPRGLVSTGNEAGANEELKSEFYFNLN